MIIFYRWENWGTESLTYPSEMQNRDVYQKLIAQEEVGFPGGFLPMQETQVRSLIWEDPTCHGPTKPVHHNFWACALETRAATTKARAPRARALQQEQPPKWEAPTPQLE